MRKIKIYKYYWLYEDGRCYSLRSERFLNPTKSPHGVWRYSFTIKRKSTNRSIAVLLKTYFEGFDPRTERIKYLDKENYMSARVLSISDYMRENKNKNYSIDEAIQSSCNYAKRFYAGDTEVLTEIYRKLLATANRCFSREVLHESFIYTIQRMKEYNIPMSNVVGYMQTVAKFKRYVHHKNYSIENFYRTPEQLRTECLTI